MPCSVNSVNPAHQTIKLFKFLKKTTNNTFYVFQFCDNQQKQIVQLFFTTSFLCTSVINLTELSRLNASNKQKKKKKY